MFAGPFVCRCLTSQAMLRFHFPLVKPDRRISRIRLPDKDAHLGPRAAARTAALRGRACCNLELLSGSGLGLRQSPGSSLLRASTLN